MHLNTIDSNNVRSFNQLFNECWTYRQRLKLQLGFYVTMHLFYQHKSRVKGTLWSFLVNNRTYVYIQGPVFVAARQQAQTVLRLFSCFWTASINFSFLYLFLSSSYELTVKNPHHLPLAADLWFSAFTLCRSASSRQQYDFLEKLILRLLSFCCHVSLWLAQLFQSYETSDVIG